MPFTGNTTVINNGSGSAYPDENHNGIPDFSDALTDGVNVVTAGEVVEMEQDVVDLENNKMDKDAPIDGGAFE